MADRKTRRSPFSVTGLLNRHADFCGFAEVVAAHGDVDADGGDRALNGRTQPDGTLDDAVQHYAERQHHEHHVDERHEHGRVSEHGFNGDVDVACGLP